MDRLENFQKALYELVEGLVREKTQDRLDALTNYVEGRLQGFTEAFRETLQNLRIQAADLEARNSLEEHRKKVTEKLKEARDAMHVLAQGLEKHSGLIKGIVEKLAAVSDAVGVVDKKINDFWEKYHAEMEQVNLRLESLQTSFETLSAALQEQKQMLIDVNSEVKALHKEFSTAVDSLRDTINLQITALREEFDVALQEAVKEFSVSLRELREEVEQKLETLNSQVKALHEENQVLRERVQHLEEENKILSGLKPLLESLTAKVEVLEGKVSSLQEEREALKQELHSKVDDWREEVMASLERLFAQVESLQKAQKDAFPADSPK